MTDKKHRPFRKDESLDQLARLINVAQFVSFSPGQPIKQEYSRVLGFPPNHVFKELSEAIEHLLIRSPEASLNVRSYTPHDPKSNEFLYGMSNADDIESAVLRIAASSLHVIINETVDVHDGGVSGVIQGGAIEFAPDDTPRCVEKPGVASFPARWGTEILQRVYGFPLNMNVTPNSRLEFSIHPKPRGWKHTNVLGWELENIGDTTIRPTMNWPNHFSRLIGDKAFGLLLAAQMGLPVPKTTVINRRIAPFTFGNETGSTECWIRTCPKEQIPGKFTTNNGWIDPFKLLASEDPSGDLIASILAQSGIPSQYSGALIVGADGKIIIEGKSGEGEALMKGVALPEVLPPRVIRAVEKLYDRASVQLGPVRIEWVFDGDSAWIVQLHRGATTTKAEVLVPGEAARWRRFEVSKGLEALRKELSALDPDEGIVLIGQIGLTSHIADVIRKVNKPARLN